MSITSAECFVKKMSSDTSFRTAMLLATNDTERKQQIEAAGFAFSSEELKHVLQCQSQKPLSEMDVVSTMGGVCYVPATPKDNLTNQ